MLNYDEFINEIIKNAKKGPDKSNPFTDPYGRGQLGRHIVTDGPKVKNKATAEKEQYSPEAVVPQKEEPETIVPIFDVDADSDDTMDIDEDEPLYDSPKADEKAPVFEDDLEEDTDDVAEEDTEEEETESDEKQSDEKAFDDVIEEEVLKENDAEADSAIDVIAEEPIVLVDKESESNIGDKDSVLIEIEDEPTESEQQAEVQVVQEDKEEKPTSDVVREIEVTTPEEAKPIVPLQQEEKTLGGCVYKEQKRTVELALTDRKFTTEKRWTEKKEERAQSDVVYLSTIKGVEYGVKKMLQVSKPTLILAALALLAALVVNFVTESVLIFIAAAAVSAVLFVFAFVFRVKRFYYNLTFKKSGSADAEEPSVRTFYAEPKNKKDFTQIKQFFDGFAEYLAKESAPDGGDTQPTA